MSYYITQRVQATYDETLARVTALLKEEGFGIITEIDVKETLKKKLGVDFRKYKILGACNPAFAHKALEAEDKIGTMLPCNVIVQEVSPGETEVSAINPLVSMQAIGNPSLGEIARQIAGRLQKVVTSSADNALNSR